MVELKSEPTKRAPTGFAYTGIGRWKVGSRLPRKMAKHFRRRASSPALLDVTQGKSQDSLNAMILDYEKRSAEPARRR
jgi:hypothetical protein